MNLAPAERAASARVLGVDSRRLGPAELARIGYVSENQRLPEHLTIAGLEAFCRPLYPTWDDAFATELRDALRPRSARRGSRRSRAARGSRRRSSPRSRRARPAVLDEPFSGLDPVVRDDLTAGLLSSPIATSGACC